MENSNLQKNVSKFGYRISLATAVLAIITLGIAVGTPPMTGPFCQADCFQYPYSEIGSRFPRDYIWMVLAIILSFLYLMMMLAFHQSTKPEKRLDSSISSSFAIMAAFVLSVNYFLQLSVIQPSVLAGETDGIALLTQFNPHGIFIALEEIGFTLIVLSFFALVPVFSTKNAREKAIKWTAISGLLLTVIMFIIISVIHGIHREYRFEVAIISISWIELIVMGFLFAGYFKKTRRGISF